MSTSSYNCLHCQQPLAEATERGIIRYCASCGHRVDVPRVDCDCRGCAEIERLLVIRAREQERKQQMNERRHAG